MEQPSLGLHNYFELFFLCIHFYSFLYHHAHTFHTLSDYLSLLVVTLLSYNLVSPLRSFVCRLYFLLRILILIILLILVFWDLFLFFLSFFLPFLVNFNLTLEGLFLQTFFHRLEYID